MSSENKVEEPGAYCLGEKGWHEFGENSQGLKLCRYFWPATTATNDNGKSPKAVILAIHGHGGHLCAEYLRCKVIYIVVDNLI